MDYKTKVKLETLQNHGEYLAKKFAEWISENHYRLMNVSKKGEYEWESPSSPNGNTQELFNIFKKELENG